MHKFPKRLLALLLALLMCVCLFPASALAEGGAISLSSTKAERGEEFSLSVSMDANPGVMYLSLTPVYAGEALELLRMEAAGTGWYVGAKAAVWDGAGDSAFTGPVLTLHFRVKGDAAPGQTSVSLEVEAVNHSEEDVPFAVSAGRVTVLVPDGTEPAPEHEPEPGHESVPSSVLEPLALLVRSFFDAFFRTIQELLKNLITSTH